MTCIVAISSDDGRIYMGGDSAGIDFDSALTLGIGAETKIWEDRGILFGAAGSFRVSQVIRWQTAIPLYNSDVEPLEYITGPLMTALRESLEHHGSLTTWEEDSTQGIDGSLLLGFRGGVYEVYEDFGVGHLIHGYGAVGCGATLALGNLVATEDMDVSPKKRIKMALKAAERHSAGVRGPFSYLTSEKQ